ncbi:FGGY-family carbohydrate kinase [Roseinatronobacter alkalisoli]|uniref:Carbohydrate kinase n=1 Tax=Roseinatronobacter alkalisoli TaxID=3028235 RepID=A0ABT5TH92_9RHOB|nr:FGGY-family carbohydrate kinase [Roseinatronobacter sp. HJB301]MDD7973547.1 carbohydrate kinase [Roseinatronobacter sp. HJB301]
MSDDLLIAIDAGGTTVKVVAFNLRGIAVATETAAVETIHHADGRAEREVESFWNGIVLALRRLMTACAGHKILGVGCTGFGNGIFLVDDAGNGTRAGIVSVDHRAQPLVDELMATNQAAGISAITGHRIWGGQTLMQLAQLARTEPAVMARTRWALACKDLIRLRLTGAAFTDSTDASGGGMMDLQSGGYALSVFEQLGLSAHVHRLPPIVYSDAIAGHVSRRAAEETGLPEGTPVAGSMMDVAACTLGAGSFNAAFLTMIAGTWSINCLETGPTGNEGTGVPILNMLYRSGGSRLIAEGSPSSAANLGWFLDHVMRGQLSVSAANELVAACPVTTRRCQFLPYIFGPEPRRGGFVDMSAADNLGTMLLAIYEGVVFQARRHADEAVALAGRPFPPTIRLAGGGAKSPVWAQIFANICQRPVEAVRAPEVGALGAAICAAVACGAYGDLAEASSQMTGAARRYTPDPALADFYDDRFKKFRLLDEGIAAQLKTTAP